MKTERKKNNKMVLALAVVAALAMVSVAGISLLQSDDSDAAGTYIPLTPGKPFVIDDASTTSYDFYVDEGASGVLVIKITEQANYSGTLSIGTLSSEDVYTAYTSIELKDAKAVQLTAVASAAPTGLVSFFALGNIDKKVDGVLPAGTYDLKQGQVVLGSLDSDVIMK
ncbi:MAG: hypothetical protein LBJ20_05930, partial [Candidatus Methanoplasma sp.]|nr:hypothetical protein [Candidatus Methanoplasma sp.]